MILFTELGAVNDFDIGVDHIALSKVGVHAGIVDVAFEILALKKRFDGFFYELWLREEPLVQLTRDLRRGI